MHSSPEDVSYRSYTGLCTYFKRYKGLDCEKECVIENYIVIPI
jgi:hypothetical protein